MSDQNKEFENLGKEVLGDIDEEDLEESVSDEIDEAEKELEEEEQEATLSEREDLSPEEAEALKEEKVRRLMQILSRGVVNDQLQRIVDEATPSGFRSKFVRDNPGDITRYQNLGYGFTYTEGATGAHGTGDSRIKYGDVVLMTISEDDYDILQEVRRRQIRQKLGEGRRDYHRRTAKAQEHGAPVAPTFDNSETVIREERVS